MKPGQSLSGYGPISIRGAEAAALIVFLNAATLLVVAFSALAPTQKALPRAEIAHKVDVLSASEGELSLLPGIGPARAARIAASRSSRSSDCPFRILEDAGLSPDEARSLAPLVVTPGGNSR